MSEIEPAEEMSHTRRVHSFNPETAREVIRENLVRWHLCAHLAKEVEFDGHGYLLSDINWETVLEHIDIGVELGLSYDDLLDWLTHIAQNKPKSVTREEVAEWAAMTSPRRLGHLAVPDAPSVAPPGSGRRG